MVDTIMDLTGGIGTDRAIDAVGVDAMHPHSAPATNLSEQQQRQFQEEVQEIAPERFADEKESKRRRPGDAPSQALQWASLRTRPACPKAP